MIFTEARFIEFFVLVFALHWALPRNQQRKVFLLGASYVFYAAWDWRFLSLIIISGLVDFVVGIKIFDTDGESQRRRWLYVSLLTNLGMLGFFKYFNFFVDSGGDFLRLIGLPMSRSNLEIILPVGISFFTFQTLSYSIDIYRRRLEPSRSLLDVMLFVGFFPQLVAGPIVRAAHFLPQLTASRLLADIRARRYVSLFLVGFIKKACISDNIAPFVDQYFAAPMEFTAMSAWIATLLYAVQIYCDFSGYTDMAIGCAGLLGYDIGVNFDFPYYAADIRDFWRRWHISLSTWLRDYLYIPLGGSHGTKVFVYRNVLLTMLLGGLWHGAAWNFVIWGGLHGVALIVHREWRERGFGSRLPSLIGRLGAPLLTMWWVLLGWIFFRAEGLGDALRIVRAFVWFDAPGTRELSPLLFLVFAGLAVVHGLNRLQRAPEWVQGLSPWAFWPVYGATVAVALAFVRPVVKPFIYFQF